MKRSIALAMLLLAAALTACSHRRMDLTRSSTQDNFGVEAAKMNLWREAMFRFRRAVELQPGNAMARNNLAVALEANGDFDAAGREYREALKLDRSNTYIQKNYSRYTEFMARTRKRPARGTSASASTPASTPAPAPAPAPVPPSAPRSTPTPTPPPAPTPPGGHR